MIQEYIFYLLLVFMFAAAWRYPPTVIASGLCMFGLDQIAAAISPFFAENSSFINYLYAVAVGVAYISHILRFGIPRLRMSVTLAAFIILFVYAFFTAYFLNSNPYVRELWYGNAPYIIIFSIAVPMLINSTHDYHLLFRYMIVFGGTITVIALFGLEWKGRGIAVAEAAVLDTGVESSNPLAISQMAGYVAIAALFLSHKKKLLIHVAILLLIGCCIMLAIKSGSRGQVVFMLFALVAASPFAFGRKSLLIIGAFSIVGVLLVGWGINQYWKDSDKWTASQMQEDRDMRLYATYKLLDYWSKQSYRDIFLGVGNSASFEKEVTGSEMYVHNVSIEILAEEGVFGFLVYLIGIMYAVRSFWLSIIKRPKRKKQYSALVVVFGIAIFELLLTFKQGNLVGMVIFPLVLIIMTRFAQLDKLERA